MSALSEAQLKWRNLLILVNERAGGFVKEKENELVGLLNQYGFTFTIVDVTQLDQIHKPSLVDVHAIVILGGDGTVRSVIEQLHDQPVVFTIIPCGTFNHLAKDLKIPADIPSCVTMLRTGQTTQVDLAKVNDHYFLNNSAIGLYPRAVKHRRQYLGWPKWLATTVSMIKILQRWPVFKVQYIVANRPFELITPLVFIANNAYELNVLKLTHRDNINAGQLVLYINQAKTRLKFLRLLWVILLRRRQKIPGYFRIERVSSCQLVFTKPQVDVAVDGEVLRLNTPLNYRIHPRCLTFIIPPASS